MEQDRVYFRGQDVDEWFSTPELTIYSPSLVSSRNVYVDSQPVGEAFQGSTTAEVSLTGLMGPYGYAVIRGNTPGGSVTLFEINGNGMGTTIIDSGVIAVPPGVTSFYCGASYNGPGYTRITMKFRARNNP